MSVSALFFLTLMISPAPRAKLLGKLIGVSRTQVKCQLPSPLLSPLGIIVWRLSLWAALGKVFSVIRFRSPASFLPLSPRPRPMIIGPRDPPKLSVGMGTIAFSRRRLIRSVCGWKPLMVLLLNGWLDEFYLP